MLIRSILLLMMMAIAASGDIYQWEWIDPNNQSLGRRQSSVLAPDGAGHDATAYADLDDLNLSLAWLADSELIGARFEGTNLANADLSNSDLRFSRFSNLSQLDGAYFDNAQIEYARLSGVGLVLSQLYATASYQNGFLHGVDFDLNVSGGQFQNMDLYSTRLRRATSADFMGANLVRASLYGTSSSPANADGANFSNANLTETEFVNASLDDAVFTNARVRGASFGRSVITESQLQSTASYQERDLTGIDFSFGALGGWNFNDQNLTQADFSRADINQISFESAILHGASFSRASLDGANFRNSDLEFTEFDRASLLSTDFSNAHVERTDFAGSFLSSGQLYSTASYQNQQLTGINLSDMDLNGWNFEAQDLKDANLTDADLAGASFSNANLEGTYLRDAYLTGTDFSNARVISAFFDDTTSRGFTASQLYTTASYVKGDLRGIVLKDNVLDGWNFSSKSMHSANFHNSSLENADFANADLTDASFFNSHLDGAEFDNATVTGAYFGVQSGGGLTRAQFESTASFQQADVKRIRFFCNDLAGWDFTDLNLTDAAIEHSDLTSADFTGADLSRVDFSGSELAQTVFVDATITGANFRHTELTLQQLMTTRSFNVGNLSGVNISSSLGGANFANMDLTDTSLGWVGDADFTGARIEGARIAAGMVADQLYSTASYQEGSLRGFQFPPSMSSLDLADQDLSNAILSFNDFAGHDLSGAIITNARFANATENGFSATHLYSTHSYQMRKLSGIVFDSNAIVGWDFVNQDITNTSFDTTVLEATSFRGATGYNASFQGAVLTDVDFTNAQLANAVFTNAVLQSTEFRNADLSGAEFFGADFSNVNLEGAIIAGTKFQLVTGLTAEAVYSTRSYQLRDLRGIHLSALDLRYWDLTEANLTDARFYYSTLMGADFSRADLRGATDFSLLPNSPQTSNTIFPDGRLHGLSLEPGDEMQIRDYDNLEMQRIHVLDNFQMADDSQLEIVMSKVTWGSTIEFEPGIEVLLDGTLLLTVEPSDGIALSSLVGTTYQVFDWSGVSTSNQFQFVATQEFADWDVSQLYITGEVTLNAVALPCDFDSSGTCDVDDIDALIAAISLGNDLAEFDLDGDGLVTINDRDVWLTNAGTENIGAAYLVGDANLDGFVDGLDFVAWNDNRFSAIAVWSAGDFNGDGVVDGLDYIAWNDNKFQSSNAIAVPEPSVGIWTVLTFCALTSCNRRRRQATN